jgi:predicted amidohydrolase
MNTIRVAFLHLNLLYDDFDFNKKYIEKSLFLAYKNNVDIVLTPELAVSGLKFFSKKIINKICVQPDNWMKSIMSKCKKYGLNLFLGSPEKDFFNNKYYNSIFFINSDGVLVGKQRKFSSFIDEWSSPGNIIEVFEIFNKRFGIVICADAYEKEFSNYLKSKNVDIVLAPSSWGPGLYGPNGEWESRSIETGIPFFVCNRTGEEKSLKFWNAESSLIVEGKRIFSFKDINSNLLIFDWDLNFNCFIYDSYFTLPL